LQAEGSLSVSLQWGKVGRPRHVYALTERAAQYFPTADAFTDDFPIQARAAISRLFEKLRARLAPAQLEALLERMRSSLIARYSASATTAVGSLDLLASRVQQLAHTLGEAGFRAEVQQGVHQGEGALILKTAHCSQAKLQPDVARQDVFPAEGAHHHTEVCRIDQSLIRSVLGSPVEQTACVLQGDRSCVFSVQA
jgi:predicted ArsR family transcriptional regulator